MGELDDRTADDVALLDDGFPSRSIRQIIVDRWSSKGYRRCIGCLGFFGILFLCGSIALFVTFQHIVEIFVRKNVVFRNGTELFEMWRDPPVPIYLRIHMFNITNQNDFPWNLKKPVVQELGPYVFREHWLRDQIRFFDNGTLSYQRVKTFFFESSLSNGTLDDVIHGVNVPLLTAVYLFKNSNSWVKFAMASVFHLLHEAFVIKKTVRELIFDGYEDPLIKVGKEIFKTYPFDKFAYFFGKNGTSDGYYNIETGVTDSYRFSVIDSWNGKANLSIWDAPTCNMINGTDGSSFPPLLDLSSHLYVFISDLCRSIPLEYKESTERHAIPVYRYTPSEYFLDNGLLLPENKCYCTGKCLNSGAYNMSRCQYGAPVFVSYPHFYNADPSYAAALHGLNPNQTIHESEFFIEPESGVPVEVGGRFQLNAHLERISGFMHFDTIPNMLFPILWFEEVTELNDEYANKLRDMTQNPYLYGRIVTYSLLVLGLILGISAVLYFVMIRTRQNRLNENGT